MRDYKLVILGAGGIGKSAITAQYVQGIFLDHYDPTIEDSYRRQAVVDGRPCSLEILDTAGIEQFTAMRELYIKNSEGFVLAYSTTNRASFNELSALHAQVIKIKDNRNVPIVLVGNKSDLESERQVSTHEGEILAKEWGRIPFFETSAKADVNIENTFHTLVSQMLRRDSAIGSSIRIPSIAGSSESDSTRIHHQPSKPNLTVKQSFSKLRHSRSIRKLASVASFAQLKERFQDHKEKNQGFNEDDGYYLDNDTLPTPAAISAHNKVYRKSSNHNFNQSQPLPQIHPTQQQQQTTLINATYDDNEPIDEGTLIDQNAGLDARPEIPFETTTKNKKKKNKHCIIM